MIFLTIIYLLERGHRAGLCTADMAFQLRFQTVMEERVADLAASADIRVQGLQRAAGLRVQADFVKKGVPAEKVRSRL